MLFALLVLFGVDLLVVDPLGAVVHLGPMTVPASAPAAGAVAVALAARRPPAELAGWRWSSPALHGPLTVGVPALVALAAVAATRSGAPGLVAGIAVHAATEEVVFRVAVPVVVALAARGVGLRAGPAGVAGVVVAAWVFAVMPGHLDQMAGHADVLPFLTFGLATGWIAWRTRSLAAVVVAHVAHNLGDAAGLGGLHATGVAAFVVWCLLATDRAPVPVVLTEIAAGPVSRTGGSPAGPAGRAVRPSPARRAARR